MQHLVIFKERGELFTFETHRGLTVDQIIDHLERNFKVDDGSLHIMERPDFTGPYSEEDRGKMLSYL